MEFERPLTNLNNLYPRSAFAIAEEWPSTSSKAEYRNEKYPNLKLATPILQPVKGKVDIPPLEGFPKPAIPVNSDFIFNLSADSK